MFSYLVCGNEEESEISFYWWNYVEIYYLLKLFFALVFLLQVYFKMLFSRRLSQENFLDFLSQCYYFVILKPVFWPIIFS